eukprot:CAMPEP_0168526648 /NCGR_PEP_ID=MMETSP0405-20121227/12107_1 /TAXON_ID=498012 /ORGANISM="Trichosphaerium sp, Strain Am-I-7 wt" /LENGTH=315 /DNA_ID=CAMNT_0008549559 /DNA_START=85 /DNA_END=1029 /DNA_ORIENTATION=-
MKFLPNSSISQQMQKYILEKLYDVTRINANKGVITLEAILQRIDAFTDGSSKTDPIGIPGMDPKSLTPQQHRNCKNVPHPRYAQAVFQPNGSLVMFASSRSISIDMGCAPYSKYLNIVCALAPPSPTEMPPLQNAVEEHQELASSPSMYSRPPIYEPTLQQRRTVTVFHNTKIEPLNRELAEQYEITGKSRSELCCHNAAVALEQGRPVLSHTWQALAAISNEVLYTKRKATKSFQALEIPWQAYPLGQALVKKIFQQYIKARDIQTLAVMSCILAPKYDKSIKGGYFADSLLEPSLGNTYDLYRIAYANLLHSW